MSFSNLQRYPFKMNIHEFICYSAEKAVAKISFSANDYCCNYGNISPSYLIECMGQIVEKCLCSQGGTKKRYLVGIDKFSIDIDFHKFIGQSLDITAKQDIKMGRISRYSVEISCEGIKVCNCLITHCEK